VLTVKELLTEKYLQWQQSSGALKTQAEFAAYIGENDKYLNMVMNGRKASKRQVEQFAQFFKDPRFYDATDLPRPDPDLQNVIHGWADLPDQARMAIREIMEEYKTTHE
jgi:hypothetical protein